MDMRGDWTSTARRMWLWRSSSSRLSPLGPGSSGGLGRWRVTRGEEVRDGDTPGSALALPVGVGELLVVEAAADGVAVGAGRRSGLGEGEGGTRGCTGAGSLAITTTACYGGSAARAGR